MFGLLAETRQQKGGITSNRISACYGEHVLRSCTHRPSRAGSIFGLKCFFFFNLFNNIRLFLIKFFLLNPPLTDVQPG